MNDFERIAAQSGSDIDPRLAAQSASDADAYAQAWLAAQLGRLGLERDLENQRYRMMRKDEKHKKRMQRYAAIGSALGSGATIAQMYLNQPTQQPTQQQTSTAHQMAQPWW